EWLRQLADGVDDRPVVPNREVKSSGSENTYPTDLVDLEAICAEIREMAARAASWLIGKHRLARTGTIKGRYSDFTTVTRSHSSPPSHDSTDIITRAVQLLAKTHAGRRPVRLLGVSVHNFCSETEGTSDGGDLPFGDREIG